MVLGQFVRFSQEEREPISASSVRLFLLSLQDRQLPPHTVHIYYRSLNTFFSWLEAEGLIAKSPMANIKPPKVPRQVIKPFSQQDIENLLLLCSGDKFLDVRNRAMVLLFLDTGLRLAEVNVGDIVTLHYPGEGLITHRVVHSEPLSHGSYLVVTKGDANRFAEACEISADGTVAVALARVRFAGYVLEFLGSIFGRVLLIAVPMVALIAMWVRRGRIVPSGKV